jgi:hypothetical protein
VSRAQRSALAMLGCWALAAVLLLLTILGAPFAWILQALNGALDDTIKAHEQLDQWGRS